MEDLSQSVLNGIQRFGWKVASCTGQWSIMFETTNNLNIFVITRDQDHLGIFIDNLIPSFISIRETSFLIECRSSYLQQMRTVKTI